MKIGELAKLTDTLVETIRYYEKIGLLMKPIRNLNNYRQYSTEHKERLIFIYNCRLLGLSHPEIRQLININDHSTNSCMDTVMVLNEHLEHVNYKIEKLFQLKNRLIEIKSQCHREEDLDGCEILHVLTNSNVSQQDSQNSQIEDIHQADHFIHN